MALLASDDSDKERPLQWLKEQILSQIRLIFEQEGKLREISLWLNQFFTQSLREQVKVLDVKQTLAGRSVDVMSPSGQC